MQARSGRPISCQRSEYVEGKLEAGMRPSETTKAVGDSMDRTVAWSPGPLDRSGPSGNAEQHSQTSKKKRARGVSARRIFSIVRFRWFVHVLAQVQLLEALIVNLIRGGLTSMHSF